MTAAAGERPAQSRRTLRAQVAAAFGFTALLAALSLVVVGWAFERQVDARGRVINRIDPAAIAARDVFAALVDQESGVRGYVLSGKKQFLDPFNAGSRQQVIDARRLRSLIQGDELLESRTAALERAAKTWREQSGLRLVRTARAGMQPSEGTLLRSKQRFDAVRIQFASLEAGLNAARATAREQISTSTTQVVVLAIVVIALLVACAVTIWIGLRRLVLVPIDRLGRDAHLVTDGDVAHAIAPSGPKELSDLGEEVEAMRQRISDDLAAADLATRTLQRQAIELGRSNAELEQFAYVASHDLQEPLRKITSFCQLIEQRYGDQLDERGKQYIEFAVDGAKRMQQLILDLLAFSRVGRTTAGFVPTNLNAMAAQAVENLDLTGSSAITIGELPTVDGDPTLLTALFQNLISNAMKFNASPVPSVTISARPSGDGWELACADNGIGIDLKHRDRVFMIFQRLHGRDAFEGNGIGLALCQKIVTYHEGTIWIDPDVTEGTTIRWTLPTMPEHLISES